MIKFLSIWAKNISLALIIVSILEMLLPNNKTKKYVKVIMGLYILFSIISPFIENSNAINLNEFDFNEYIEKDKVGSKVKIEDEINQKSMDERINQIYKEKLEKDIEEKLLEIGYKIDNCKVIAHISEENNGIEKIVLNVNSKIPINEKDINENKLVNESEVQEIQKIQVGEDVEESNMINEKNTNSLITKTDIKNIKDFLAKEYGVDEKCLKIN